MEALDPVGTSRRVRRFSELRRGVSGITARMLIQQLRDLESDGIVHREIYREVPPRVEYSLAALGSSLNIRCSLWATGARSKWSRS
jgi:DNA-binding HxlR family transcriptional regulator